MNVFPHLLLVIVSVWILFPQAHGQTVDPMEEDDFLEMSIEDLINLPVEVSGSLTETSRRTTPSTVTTITKEDIRRSAARNLDELLDIYVPNYQMMLEFYEFRKSGLRGINSDRDDKYLILVNGRIMNEKTHAGAFSERDLPMLTDIHHIDVIRGPGSALYGPGAVAMVVNIITENSKTYEGTEVTNRVGGIEEFYSTEIKHGSKFTDDTGLFVYLGVSKYLGSDQSDSDFEVGRPDQFLPFDFPINSSRHRPRMHGSWRGQPKWKAYSEFTSGNFYFWARYTRGGEYRDIFPYRPLWFRTSGEGYQQLTLTTGYEHEITDTFSVDTSISWDGFDMEKITSSRIFSYREDEYTGKVIGKWTPDENHSLALGGEVSHEQFGLKSPGYPHDDQNEVGFWYYWYDKMPRWKTTLYSGLAEYQWKMSDEWTAFVGGRWDHHPTTGDLYSPRASLVYAPTEKDTCKMIFSRSVRNVPAGDMKLDKTEEGRDPKPERLYAYELRYERQHLENLWLASSLFYHDHFLSGYNFNLGYNTRLGTAESWGVELEAAYRNDDTSIVLSHAYTKLIGYEREPDVSDMISTEPDGYGNDFMNWSNHISKLTARQQITDKLGVDSSVRVYWGYPGFEDYARLDEDTYAVTKADRTHFGIKCFLNLGLEYAFRENLIMRLNGHDLIGFIDKKYNQKLFGYDFTATTRSYAPSFSVSLYYKF